MSWNNNPLGYGPNPLLGGGNPYQQSGLPYGQPIQAGGGVTPGSMLAQRAIGGPDEMGVGDKIKGWLGGAIKDAGNWIGKNPDAAVQGLGIAANVYGAHKARGDWRDQQKYERGVIDERREQTREDREREEQQRRAMSPYYQQLMQMILSEQGG